MAMAFAPPLFSRRKAGLGRQKCALRRECFLVAVVRRLQSWRSPSRTRLWRLMSRRISSTTSGVPYDSCPPSLPPALFIQIQLCPGISCGGGKIPVLRLSRSFFVLKKAGSGFLFCVFCAGELPEHVPAREIRAHQVLQGGAVNRGRGSGFLL